MVEIKQNNFINPNNRTYQSNPNLRPPIRKELSDMYQTPSAKTQVKHSFFNTGLILTGSLVGGIGLLFIAKRFLSKKVPCEIKSTIFKNKSITIAKTPDVIKPLTAKIEEYYTIPKEQIEGMLSVENISSITKYLLTDIKNIRQGKNISDLFEINGQKVSARLIGNGGSKNVFLVEHNGEESAIAICGTVDDAQTTINKWRDVINEPKNTKYLRNLGFYVNNISEIIPIKINGIDFPALKMKPYSSHSFEIFDLKNFDGNNLLTEGLEKLDNEKVIGYQREVKSGI
jgi:hypothetical protein